MKLKEFNVLLDIKESNSTTYIEVVQGDYGTNTFIINLTDNFNLINLTNLNVEVVFRKADGKTVVQDTNTGVSIEDAVNGKIKCTLLTNTIACPGRVTAEVRILEGNNILTSARFNFFVRASLTNDETVKSTNEFPILKKLTDDVKEANEEFPKIKEFFNTVRNEEETRVNQENTRTSNENSRQTSENQRVDNETSRNENEKGRITAENVRKDSENIRKSNEDIRDKSEQKRVNIFNTNENSRKNEFNEIKNEYSTLKKVMIDENNAANLQNQINNVNSQLTENATKVVEETANVISLPNSVDGILNFELQGETLKNEVPNYSKWSISYNAVVDAVTNTVTVTASGGKFDGINIKTNLKPSTTYTVIVNVVSNNLTDEYRLVNGNDVGEGITVGTGKTGLIVKKFTTASTITNNFINTYVRNTEVAGKIIKLKDFMLLEGDWTNKEIPTYFEGIQSVGNYAGAPITNIVQNGDFRDGITGWINANGISITLDTSDSILKITTTAICQGAFQDINAISNHKYYVNGTMGANSKLQLKQFDTQGKEWRTTETSSSLMVTTGSTINKIRIFLTNGYTATGTFTFGNIRCIDLTSTFGEGNEPSQEWCDSNIDFFNGTTKTTDKIEVLSTGKNLWNGDFSLSTMNGDFTYNKDGGYSVTTAYAWGGFNAFVYKGTLKPSTQYVFSYEGDKIDGWITMKYGNTQEDGIVENRRYKQYTTDTQGRLGMYLTYKNAGTYKVLNPMLEEGSTATPYEPYREHKVDISLQEPLRGLPNGARDSIGSDGIRTNKVGKAVLNNGNSWYYGVADSGWKVDGDTLPFFSYNFINSSLRKKDGASITDKLPTYSAGFNNRIIESDIEGFALGSLDCSTIRISKSKLTQYGFKDGDTATYIPAFKKWLSENSVTVYYELATPTIEDTKIPLSLKCFKGGSLQTNTAFLPVAIVRYPSTISGRISTVEEAMANMTDSLGGAWKTLLSLADRELRMKSITTLTTETNADLKAKINEMIGVWK